MLDLFDMLGVGSESGKVYVPVDADDSLNGIGLLSANGSYGNATSDGIVVEWTRDKGVTNNYGWQFDNVSVNPSGKTEEEINKAIRDAIWSMSMHPRDWVNSRVGCAYRA